MSKRNIRISFSRNEIVSILDALESLEEDYKYNGGLSLIEDEMRLYERLTKRLRAHDGPPLRFPAAVPVVGPGDQA